MTKQKHHQEIGILGLPSKGRLKDESLLLLEKLGIKIKRNDPRSYQAIIEADQKIIKVKFLPAKEIVKRLREGLIDAGITGEDLLAEEFVETLPDIKEKLAKTLEKNINLGFGKANLVIAVPKEWPIETLDELIEITHLFYETKHKNLRVATKYQNLTKAFFEDKYLEDCRIVASESATELTPIERIADFITDITSTGKTLRANNLKTLNGGTILESQAQFVVRKATNKTNDMPAADLWFMKLAEKIGKLIETY